VGDHVGRHVDFDHPHVQIVIPGVVAGLSRARASERERADERAGVRRFTSTTRYWNITLVSAVAVQCQCACCVCYACAAHSLSRNRLQSPHKTQAGQAVQSESGRHAQHQVVTNQHEARVPLCCAFLGVLLPLCLQHPRLRGGKAADRQPTDSQHTTHSSNAIPLLHLPPSRSVTRGARSSQAAGPSSSLPPLTLPRAWNGSGARDPAVSPPRAPPAPAALQLRAADCVRSRAGRCRPPAVRSPASSCAGWAREQPPERPVTAE
jgi:hypothetical protein